MKRSILWGIPLLLASMGAKAQSIEPTPYSFVPVPQSITYLGGEVKLPSRIGLSFSAGIDSYTRDRAFEVFSSQDVLLGEGLHEDFSLTLSTYSEGFDKAITAEEYFPVFEKKDGYCLKIDSSGIHVVGEDTDAAFFGLATLEEILEQSDGSLRKLLIQDYSSSSYRGFIEGYYGIPWTKDERIALMESAKGRKGNLYIYAPKDDSYHSTNWRGAYSERGLATLKEVVDAGKRTKVEFAYAIHPFLHQAITSSNYEESLTQLEEKFLQLQGIGVETFMISADDIGIPEGTLYEDGSLHRRLLNDVSSFLRGKGVTNPLLFVPSAYCYQSETRLRVDLKKYYASLMDGLDSDVEILWTGDDVCTSLQTLREEEFSSLTGGKKPFYWLNWPVNDYSTSHLLLGKAEVLNQRYEEGEVPFSGIVTNPMQQAEPSKIAIDSVCAYCWNPSAFDAEEAYRASFPRLEGKEHAALEEICSYLTNATLYEGKYFEESPRLKSAYQDYASSASEDKAASSEPLKAELSRLVEACSSYLKNAENRKLLTSISPWVRKLSAIARLGLASLGIATGESQDYEGYLEQGEKLEAEAKECKAPVLNKITYNTDREEVQVGVSVLTPVVDALRAEAKDIALLRLGRDTGVTYFGFEGIYSGRPENVYDGDDSTYCWFQGKPQEGAYLRLDLGEEKDINDVEILFGNANGAGDAMAGKLQSSLDGFSFSDVGTLSGADSKFDFRDAPFRARFLRLYNEGTETWVGVREIKINQLDPNAPSYALSGIELETSVDTSLGNMGDGSLNTYAWFNINRSDLTQITLDLKKATSIHNIVLFQAKSDSPMDYFPDVSFSYSLDGKTYVELEGEYKDQKDIRVSFPSPISARYVRLTNRGATPYGVVLREFNVNSVL